MKVGVVAIGRNEGERLRQCLQSISSLASHVVYVDSGSKDGSIATAAELGASIVDLDLAIPFTAARARNAGYRHLTQMAPAVDVVQFVDGDCEIAKGWIAIGLAKLQASPRVAVVCGRRRELHPESSIYNRLCDIEWDTAVGETVTCGGDAMIRVAALEQVGGYDPSLIAGEEPDLCIRLRHRGWIIWRLDSEMTRHDATMMYFSQWWRRNVRAGHAYAESLYRHGATADPAAFHAVLSNLFWANPITWPAWPLLGWRIHRQRRDVGHASFLVLGKLPQCQGQIKYWWDSLMHRERSLIEYK